MRLIEYVRSQWAGFLALFLVIAGGTAYAANTIGSADIINGQVKSADIGTGQVQAADVRSDSLPGGGLTSDDIYSLTGDDIGDESLDTRDIDDGELDDQDIAEGAFANFEAQIGVVPAHSCKRDLIDGIDAGYDHLLLTPAGGSSADNLDYSVKYQPSFGAGYAYLVTCNRLGQDINDLTTRFNLLVIDAVDFHPCPPEGCDGSRHRGRVGPGGHP